MKLFALNGNGCITLYNTLFGNWSRTFPAKVQVVYQKVMTLTVKQSQASCKLTCEIVENEWTALISKYGNMAK